MLDTVASYSPLFASRHLPAMGMHFVFSNLAYLIFAHRGNSIGKNHPATLIKHDKTLSGHGCHKRFVTKLRRFQDGFRPTHFTVPLCYAGCDYDMGQVEVMKESLFLLRDEETFYLPAPSLGPNH